MKSNIRRFKDESFYPFLERLEFIKRGLRLRSLLVLLTLLFSLVSMAVYAFIHQYNINFKSEYSINIYQDYELPIFIAIFIFIILGIIILFNFNSLRDKGMILYEEITDEIDWSSKRKEYIHKPPIELRIIIKEFLKSTDLPFTSGKNGQGFYMLFFLIITISAILIKILM